jgi:hypothetical protein
VWRVTVCKAIDLIIAFSTYLMHVILPAYKKKTQGEGFSILKKKKKKKK